MADIFISYANEDRETAAQFAQLLESVGWHVWWDRRIPAGRTWRSILEDALREMRCLVVLWSKNSVQSPWVTEEAEEARRLGKTIVPVLIEGVEPPIGFRAIQAANLANWNGSTDDPAAQQFIADLKSILGDVVETSLPPGESSPAKTRVTTLLQRTTSARIFKFGAVIAAFVVFLVGWQVWREFSQHTQISAPVEKAAVRSAPQLASLAIRGERKNLNPAEKTKLELRAIDSEGKQAQIKDAISWSSSAPQVAGVSPEGEVMALTPGTAEIKANVGGVVSPPWAINVKRVEAPSKAAAQPKIVALRVTVGTRELHLNERIPIRVRGRYSDESEQALSRDIEWQISNRAVASISDAGELEGLRPGKTEVVARYGDLRSPPVIVLVKEPEKPAQQPAKSMQTPEPGSVKVQTSTAEVKTKVTTYVGRAGSLREQGNYAGAMAELEKARILDPFDEGVRKEIEQTKRACNAERVLGNPVSC
ncbi:MAG TPA: toll/interleukin-1 receptor domain-containing protein [Candidatus Binatia bacterium]|nr:toll/interleukin-1 receptor domain-containing protein [Candidatus Binatia bacterium]